MFFVTVGRTLPFDRLIRLVDEAVGLGWIPAADVLAQIGDGRYVPKNLNYQRFLSPEDCARTFDAATAIIGHAGVGTIMQALQRNKVLIAVPRRPEQGECVDDHQVQTARVFAAQGHVLTADNVETLAESLRAAPSFVPRPRNPRVDALCHRLSSFMAVCDAARPAARATVVPS